jgi:3-oxoacyl-[acyl-carrier protein] reductase
MGELKKFSGKVAVITGAGSGMGRQGCLAFAEQGAQVVGVDQNPDALADTAATVEKAWPGSFTPVGADLTNEEATAAAFAAANQVGAGGIDVLYHNAGIFLPDVDTVPPEMSVDVFDKIHAINLRGTYLVCKQAANFMSEGSSMVLVASISGLVGQPGQAAYSSTKLGVVALARSLAYNYSDRGIRVNALAPGGISTPMISGFMEDPEFEGWVMKQIPVGRLGRAEEVVRAALYLASEDAAYVTGSVLTIDGGLTIGEGPS